MAKQLNLRAYLHTVPLMLSVKQRSCRYQFYGHWFDAARNRTQVYPTAPEADALPLTTR